MKNNRKKYKKWLIALMIPFPIYFIWGCFGFAGAWIPGKYDADKNEYHIFWGLGEVLSDCERGNCRIAFYTPPFFNFKHGLIDTTGFVVIPFSYNYTENPYRYNPN
ncbi:hypothetical protein [Paenimyroides ummariense]|nr:hypothetical protein [Paenimyroides ummariense]